MYLYTKKDIDDLAHKAIYQTCVVSCVKLTEEDIQHYKLSLKEKGNTSKDNNTSKNDGPSKKKAKMDTNGKCGLKLVLTREGNNDKFVSNVKSANNVLNNKRTSYPRKAKYPIIPKIEIDSTSAEKVTTDIYCQETTKSFNYSANNKEKKKLVSYSRKANYPIKPKIEIDSSSTEMVPTNNYFEKTTESSNSSTNNLLNNKRTSYPRKAKYPIIPKIEIDSTSSEKVTTDIYCQETTKSFNYSANNISNKKRASYSRKVVYPIIPKIEIDSTSTAKVPIEMYGEDLLTQNSETQNVKIKITCNESIESTNILANNVFKKNLGVVHRKISSSLKHKKRIASTSPREVVTIVIDSDDSTESSYSPANSILKKTLVLDPKKINSSRNPKMTTSTSTQNVPIKNTRNKSTESTNFSANNVFKNNLGVVHRKISSSLKHKKRIASTSPREVVTIVIDSDDSTESSYSPVNSVLNKRRSVEHKKIHFPWKPRKAIASTSTQEVPIVIDSDESIGPSYSSAHSALNKRRRVEHKKINSLWKPKKAIASTITQEEVPIVIDSDESIESSYSSSHSGINKIRVIDPKKIIDSDKYKLFLKIFKSDHLKIGMKNSVLPVTLSSNGPKLSFHNTKVKVFKNHLNDQDLIEIEELYQKYFNKFAQDSIVIIANLFNIHSDINLNYETLIDQSLKERTKAGRLKKHHFACRMKKNESILEKKLKDHVSNIISSFIESDFNKAFKMFFLSILSVLGVLDPPKFKICGISKNVSGFLLNCLKKFKDADPRVFLILQSDNYETDCLSMISLIEDSRDNDPGVSDRMALFFLPNLYSREYFQEIIDALTSDSIKDLELLIDTASFNFRGNSKFKDPIYYQPSKNPMTNYE